MEDLSFYVWNNRENGMFIRNLINDIKVKLRNLGLSYIETDYKHKGYLWNAFEMKGTLKQAQDKSSMYRLKKGSINITDLSKEFLLLHSKTLKAYTSYENVDDNIEENFVDVFICLMGVAEIIGIDLQNAVSEKLEKY